MKQYILGGLSVIVVLVALLGLAIYGASKQPQVESSACRANAAEIGLNIEAMVVAKPFTTFQESALVAFVRSSREARLLIARRIELDCQTDLRVCDNVLRDIHTLRAKPRDVDLSECAILLGVEPHLLVPEPQAPQGGGTQNDG